MFYVRDLQKKNPFTYNDFHCWDTFHRIQKTSLIIWKEEEEEEALSINII